jgi:acyl-CoA hydrolase
LRRLNLNKIEPNCVSENICSHNIGPSSVVQPFKIPRVCRSATLTMTILMTPDMTNFSGNVHGGTLLKHLDEVAYACASRYAGAYVLTLSVD